MQDGEIFDKIFKLSELREKYGQKTGLFNEWVYRVFGGCSFCFSFWYSVLTFIVSMAIINHGFNELIQFNSNLWYWVFYIVWFILFSSVSTVASTKLIND